LTRIEKTGVYPIKVDSRKISLFAYSGVQHMCCFSSSCVTVCCQFLRIVYFWLLLRYSL